MLPQLISVQSGALLRLNMTALGWSLVHFGDQFAVSEGFRLLQIPKNDATMQQNLIALGKSRVLGMQQQSPVLHHYSGCKSAVFHT
jgi:hypothetical protein